MFKAIAKLSFKFLALGILTGTLWFYSSQGFSQSKPLRVVVTSQPAAPLLVLPTYVDSSDPLRPRYGYSVTNTTDKAIRAYAIQEIVSLGPGPAVIRTSMSHFPAVKLFLKPSESSQEEGGPGNIYQAPRLKWNLL